MECEYCKRILKNKWSLKTHQQTVKYCMKLQDKTNTLFLCEFCNSNISSKRRLATHINNCNANTPYVRKLLEDKDFQIQQLREEIIKLKVLQTGEKRKLIFLKI
jgi:hypothetical protein